RSASPWGIVTAKVRNYATLIMQIVGNCLTADTKRAEDEHLNAHHNPMHAFRHPTRRAPYQPKEPRRAPRGIPDQAFNELLAALPSHRDRALVAFYISAGPRASELLGVTRDRVSPGDQTIGVIRKGSQALQWIPASSDAFVWLRLYQQQIRPQALDGPEEPLWWTLRARSDR
ncbi:hypothetical protein ACH472_52765, partial [Streptomyces mirabilis]